MSPASLSDLARHILTLPPAPRRRVIALVGAPGSGKSTLAQKLNNALLGLGDRSCVLPMDGYHLDNAVLKPMGLVPRKGAPDTFDVFGFLRLIEELQEPRAVYYPVFDRTRDASLACAGVVNPDTETVIVEGNYLLYDAPGWRDLKDKWSLTLNLAVNRDELRRRLIQRWEHHGFSTVDAMTRVDANDMVNVDLILAAALPADITLTGDFK